MILRFPDYDNIFLVNQKLKILFFKKQMIMLKISKFKKHFVELPDLMIFGCKDIT
jgi:hypothetical protein